MESNYSDNSSSSLDNENDGSYPESPPSLEQDNPQACPQDVHKSKSPRMNWFPFHNNQESNMRRVLSDDTSAKTDHLSPLKSNHRLFSDRRQSLQPFATSNPADFAVVDEGEEKGINTHGFHRPRYFCHKNGSKLPIVRRESDGHLPSIRRRRGFCASHDLQAFVPDESRHGIFDVGLLTSGGLAPGSGRGDDDSRARNSQREPFRRHEDAESVVGRRRPQVATSRITNRASANDVQMLELHRRLSQLAESEERNTNKRSSAYFARNLVRQHAGYVGNGRDSPPPAAGMTRPVTSYFDTREHEEDDLPDQDEKHPENMIAAESTEEALTEAQRDPTVPPGEDYIPPPTQVRQGVLGSLLKLYGQQHHHYANSTSLAESTDVSGACTPIPRRKSFDDGSGGTIHDEQDSQKKWAKSKDSNDSSVSLSEMYYSASHSTVQFASDYPDKVPKRLARHKHSRKLSAREILRKAQERRRLEEEEATITIHIADVLQRQRFILRLCRALMMFGAPTHRLEEYMKMTSRVLSIDGQFLYIPGCMIISFGDSSTHTSEMQLVRCVQGVNLHKLHETHGIYKDVIHGYQTVDEALTHIEELIVMRNLYPPWICVFFYGFASLAVGPFAFRARWLDMPISFLLGSLVGVLQIIVAPRSSLYNNVFEVTAAIIVSFLGRVFGSIGNKQDIFCFAAISQSALALILPGYIILCGSLELQARSIVAGSVRMFYAIIYSLFLGFGITLGAAIYGWMDSSATSNPSCTSPLDDWWRVLFVPMFTVGLALVNQAHWKQIPVMVVISSAGYVVTYFSNKRLQSASELTSAIGAFVIGILGNMYSRVGHGLAFAAMLPAIFVQVPSGLAAQGSLIQGIITANNIVSTTASKDSPQPDGGSASMGTIGNLGITMVQVSIGITVGLFVATLVIYPFGKKRSGLFTF